MTDRPHDPERGEPDAGSGWGQPARPGTPGPPVGAEDPTTTFPVTRPGGSPSTGGYPGGSAGPGGVPGSGAGSHAAGSYGQPGGQPGGPPGGFGPPPGSPPPGGQYGQPPFHGGPPTGGPPPGQTWGGPSSSGGPGPQLPVSTDEAKSFFGALFDFTFTKRATPTIVKVVYLLITVGVALGYLAYSVVAFQIDAALGVFVLLILGPIVATATLAFWRMTLEFYLAVSRLSDEVRQIRMRG